MPVYSTGTAARKLGVKRYQLEYLLETDQVPEPALRVAGKRVWTLDEVERVGRFLQARDGRKPHRFAEQTGADPI